VQISAPFRKDLELSTRTSSLFPSIISEASGEAATFTTRGRAKVAMMESNFMVDWSFGWLRRKDETYERYDGKG